MDSEIVSSIFYMHASNEHAQNSFFDILSEPTGEPKFNLPITLKQSII